MDSPSLLLLCTQENIFLPAPQSTELASFLAPQSTELASFLAGSEARPYLGGDGGGELRVVIDPSVLAVLDSGVVCWLQRRVEQQVKLRLGKHLTGPEAAIRLSGDADEQHLLRSEVHERLVVWNCTVVGGGGSKEIVQQEMHGEVDPQEAEAKENQNLESAKATNFQQEVFEFHLSGGVCSVRAAVRRGAAP